MKFIGYFILISLTFIITFFLITFCFLDRDVLVSSPPIFVILIAIIDMILIIISINYTLKPILSIFQHISYTLKARANENQESSIITYLKSFCANVAIIISFILSALSLLTTIWNYVKPIAEKIKNL